MISPLENNQNCIQNSLQKKEDSLSYYCMTKVTKQGTILIHVTEEFDRSNSNNFKIFNSQSNQEKIFNSQYNVMLTDALRH